MGCFLLNNIKVIRDLNAINQNSINKLNSTNETASNDFWEQLSRFTTELVNIYQKKSGLVGKKARTVNASPRKYLPEKIPSFVPHNG